MTDCGLGLIKKIKVKPAPTFRRNRNVKATVGESAAGIVANQGDKGDHSRSSSEEKNGVGFLLITMCSFRFESMKDY